MSDKSETSSSVHSHVFVLLYDYFYRLWEADSDWWRQVIRVGKGDVSKRHEFWSDRSDSNHIVADQLWIRSTTTYESGSDLIWKKIWFGLFTLIWVNLEAEESDRGPFWTLYLIVFMFSYVAMKVQVSSVPVTLTLTCLRLISATCSWGALRPWDFFSQNCHSKKKRKEERGKKRI